jgi:hypothetical protein
LCLIAISIAASLALGQERCCDAVVVDETVASTSMSRKSKFVEYSEMCVRANKRPLTRCCLTALFPCYGLFSLPPRIIQYKVCHVCFGDTRHRLRLPINMCLPPQRLPSFFLFILTFLEKSLLKNILFYFTRPALHIAASSKVWHSSGVPVRAIFDCIHHNT